jgi:tetratricopeptide (TPR) repeat protein
MKLAAHMMTPDTTLEKAFNALKRGNAGDAELLCKRFLRAYPNHFGALNLLTVALMAMERFEEAEHHISKAVALDQRSDSSFYNYGTILKRRARPTQAIEQFDRAIKLNPKHVKAWSNRGACYAEIGQYDRAITEFDKSIEIDPSYFDAYYNKGNALSALDKPEEACAAFDKALSLNSASAEAHNNRGMALQELKRLEESLASYNKAIALKSDYAYARWNRGLNYLLSGAFENGWRDYEQRPLKRGGSGRRAFLKPLWIGGEAISGKTILVHSEQGLGDTIQFCRYVTLLSDLGARVLFAPQKPLQALMGTIDDRVEIVDVEDEALAFDFYCPLLSLPLAFKTTFETVPGKAPYLRVEPDRIRHWADRIGGDGLKIAVCWQSGAAKPDPGRSFPLAELFEISQIPGVRLIGIHKGDGLAQLQGLPEGMRVETLGEAFDGGDDAFLDTAAVMKICDLVITSDTAVAHLAGALAAPTWVALKHVPDWRWMLDRSDSPWSPTMRLFRQSTRGDWKSVFGEINKELRPLLKM